MDAAQAALEASKVDGFMFESDLRWLADQASRVKTVVELGSWKGRSTVALSAAQGIVLAVDRWDGFLDGKLVDREVWSKFRSNTAGLSNIEVYREDLGRVKPGAILKKIGPVDMVFVDADHSEEGVRRDIRTAYELLQGRGLLCGHDFHFVRGAVEELVAGYRVVAGGDIWFKVLG
jgi:predicted O-methyltransferase YrrM